MRGLAVQRCRDAWWGATMVWLAVGSSGCRSTYVKVAVSYQPPAASFVGQIAQLVVAASDDLRRDAGPLPLVAAAGDWKGAPTFSLAAPAGAVVMVAVSGLDDGGLPIASGRAFTPPLQPGVNSLDLVLTAHCTGERDCSPAGVCAGVQTCDLGAGILFGACRLPGDGGSGLLVAGAPCGPFGACDGAGSCQGALCGNGRLDPGEQCDDGELQTAGDGGNNPAANSSAPDHCRPDCRLPGCGDGVVDPDAGERCDLGAGQNGRGLGCNRTCSLRGEVTTLAGKAGSPGFVDGAGGSARFAQPGAVAVLAGGLYVVDTAYRALRRVDLATGEVLTVAGPAMACRAVDGPAPTASFCDPAAVVAWDGGLLIGDAAALRFLSLTPTLDGGVLQTWGGTLAVGSVGSPNFQPGPLDGGCAFGSPQGLAVFGGKLFSNTAVSGNIGEVDFAAGTLQSIYAFGDRFVRQGGLASLAGRIFTTDIESGGAVYALDLADLDAGALAMASGLGSPDGVCTDGVSLFVVTAERGAILQVDLDGGVSLVAGGQAGLGELDGLGAAAQFLVPQGCAFDPSTRSLYVADGVGATIRKIQ